MYLVRILREAIGAMAHIFKGSATSGRTIPSNACQRTVKRGKALFQIINFAAPETSPAAPIRPHPSR